MSVTTRPGEPDGLPVFSSVPADLHLVADGTIDGQPRTALLPAALLPSGGGGGTAALVANTPAGSISATNVQAAINELDTEKLAASHAGSGGAAHAEATTSVSGFMSAADKSKLDGLSGSVAASAVSNTPAGTIAATTVQAAINELDSEKAPASAATATGTSFTPAGSIAATTVQAAIVELDTEKAAATHTHAPAAITVSTTARLLGRVTAGSGAAEEVPLGAGLAFSGGALVNTGSGGSSIPSLPLAPNGEVGEANAAIELAGTAYRAPLPAITRFFRKPRHYGTVYPGTGRTAGERTANRDALNKMLSPSLYSGLPNIEGPIDIDDFYEVDGPLVLRFGGRIEGSPGSSVLRSHAAGPVLTIGRESGTSGSALQRSENVILDGFQICHGGTEFLGPLDCDLELFAVNRLTARRIRLGNPGGSVRTGSNLLMRPGGEVFKVTLHECEMHGARLGWIYGACDGSDWAINDPYLFNNTAAGSGDPGATATSWMAQEFGIRINPGDLRVVFFNTADQAELVPGRRISEVSGGARGWISRTWVEGSRIRCAIVFDLNSFPYAPAGNNQQFRVFSPTETTWSAGTALATITSRAEDALGPQIGSVVISKPNTEWSKSLSRAYIYLRGVKNSALINSPRLEGAQVEETALWFREAAGGIANHHVYNLEVLDLCARAGEGFTGPGAVIRASSCNVNVYGLAIAQNYPSQLGGAAVGSNAGRDLTETGAEDTSALRFSLVATDQGGTGVPGKVEIWNYAGPNSGWSPGEHVVTHISGAATNIANLASGSMRLAGIAYLRQYATFLEANLQYAGAPSGDKTVVTAGRLTTVSLYTTSGTALGTSRIALSTTPMSGTQLRTGDRVEIALATGGATGSVTVHNATVGGTTIGTLTLSSGSATGAFQWNGSAWVAA
jgi:hypothetical protein